MEKRLKGVEIFSAGTQTDSSGLTETFTADDLDEIVERFDLGSPEYVPVKLGHTTDEFNLKVAKQLGLPAEALHGENGGQDGVISLGRVVSLRRAQNKLIADFEVPEDMARLVSEGYLRDVSVELVGGPGDWTLTAVAWLGAELPAVKDLKGLAAAAVLRERAKGPVLAFKRSVVVEAPKMSLKEKILALFAEEEDGEEEKPFPPEDSGESSEEEDSEDEETEMEEEQPTVTPIEGEMAAAIKAMVGVEMNAGGEEILSAIRQLLGLPDAAPAEEVMPMMKEKLEAKQVSFKDSKEFKAMKAENEKLTKQVSDLVRDSRLAHYRAETKDLLIQGQDADLAEELVELETTAGEEVAGKLLASWKRESEANKRFTRAAGTSKPVDVNVYDFEERAKKKAETDKISYEKAFAALAQEDAHAFHTYRIEKQANK